MMVVIPSVVAPVSISLAEAVVPSSVSTARPPFSKKAVAAAAVFDLGGFALRYGR